MHSPLPKQPLSKTPATGSRSSSGLQGTSLHPQMPCLLAAQQLNCAIHHMLDSSFLIGLISSLCLLEWNQIILQCFSSVPLFCVLDKAPLYSDPMQCLGQHLSQDKSLKGSSLQALMCNWCKTFFGYANIHLYTAKIFPSTNLIQYLL